MKRLEEKLKRERERERERERGGQRERERERERERDLRICLPDIHLLVVGHKIGIIQVYRLL